MFIKLSLIYSSSKRHGLDVFSAMSATVYTVYQVSSHLANFAKKMHLMFQIVFMWAIFWQYLKTLFAYKRHYNFNSILFATLKWSWNDVNCKRTVYKIYLGRNIFHVNSSCSNLSLNDSYQMIKGKWSKMTKYRR